MKSPLRYFKVYWRLLANSIMTVTTYRVDFFLWTFVHIIELGIDIIFFQAVFLRTSQIGGWGIYEALILVGFVNLVLGLGGLTFFPMMYDLPGMVRSGELDGKITKPIDAQFLLSFPWIDVWDFVFIPNGLLLIMYGLLKRGQSEIAIPLVVFLLLLIFSMFILYSLLILAMSLAFKVVKIDAIDNLFWTLVTLGKYPASVFKGITHFVFMYVFPVGLIMTVPVQALTGFINIKDIILSALFAIFLFFISRRLFYRGLKNYASASS